MNDYGDEHLWILNINIPRKDVGIGQNKWVCTRCGWTIENMTHPINIKYGIGGVDGGTRRDRLQGMTCPETLAYLIMES
jgi:hypothetical protein